MEREFKDIFPNGLNKSIVLFNKSLYEIMTTDEIDKVINCAKSSREKKWLKEFRNAYGKPDKFYSIPIWPALHCMESPELLKNIVCNMITLDKEVIKDENEV